MTDPSGRGDVPARVTPVSKSPRDATAGAQAAPDLAHQPRLFGHLEDLAACVGQEIGLSDWLVVTQARIDGFAQATGDEQWIHVDPVRAAAGPFGATIAHGFLTLSLVPALMATAFRVDDVRMGINYGLNRVRFIHPVRSGSSLRGRFQLSAFDPLDSGAQLTTSVTLEMRGSDRPACVVEAVSRLFT